MGVNSGKAFDEVKRLLGRLDRNIDEARTKRLGPEDEPEPARPSAPSPTIGQATPPPPISPTRSKYGRAKPLRRGEGPQGNGWQRPVQGGDDTLIG